jgi:UDP-N-acetylglucosamine 2-epimerase (non-hydrolysing)/GDP/UDP-N,N'-diacetylbacillosamine 2-epimerase (hydrolysing)
VRSIGVVTVARSDYGLYRPALRRIEAEPDLNLRLYVTGMHLSPEFGDTIKEIEADGFSIAERIEMLVSSDTPEGVAKSVGLGTIGFAQAFGRERPDLLVLLGDRFEMLAAASAALPFAMPLAHIHGGETTQGAIDEAIRHSLTKMSHLHFVATETYARRVWQLGEEPWRITVSGAPGLDNLGDISLLDPAEIEAKFGLRLTPETLLVTYHPVTLEYEQTEWQMQELLAALEEVHRPIIFTYPNADTRGRSLIALIEAFTAQHPQAQAVAHLGTQGYFSLMRHVAAMVGNSSSGLIEAGAFELPTVNIGNRQLGRVRGANVIDVGYGRSEIIAGIRRAVSPEFRASLRGMRNPYGDGHAAERIVNRLKSAPLDERLLLKRFYDLERL